MIRNANHSVIVGGTTNTLSGACGFIGGGTSNTIKPAHTNSAIVTSNLTSVSSCMLHAFSLFLSSIPTCDPSVLGVVWRSGTDLKISLG